MNQPWKLILLLIGIFCAGAVAGGFVTLRIAHHSMPRPPSPEQWGPARLKKISEKLNLTPEQEEKLRPIMRRDMEDLGRVRTSSFAESKRIFERMEHDIAEVLTPEQKEKFEQMNRERREHDDRHRDHDHPDAPPPDEPAPQKPPGSI